MSKPLPSIRQQLFRIHLVIGLIATLLLSIAIGFADWRTTRQLMRDNFKTSIAAAAQGTETYLSLKDIRSLAIHLRDFQHMPGLTTLCVYSVTNTLIYNWHRANTPESCPRLILREGMEDHWFTISIAQSLTKDKKFIGTLYAESKVTEWNDLLQDKGIIFAILLTAVIIGCYIGARAGARLLTQPIAALDAQIECLRTRDFNSCNLIHPMQSAEAAALADTITKFRSHLATATMPRVQLKQLRQWYCTLFFGWITNLRQQLHADSPLINTLADYEMLLGMDLDNPLPAPELFDLAPLLKTSTAAARAICREQDHIHLNASLQSSTQHRWLGHPEMLRTLLQHLIMIGLKRTTQGAVCIRLEIETIPRNLLRIKLEDSGPQLQAWQLRQWLSPAADDVPTTETAQQISWLLVGRLFFYLGGEVQAETIGNDGLHLTGIIPLDKPAPSHFTTTPAAPIATPAPNKKPLILAVEDQPAKRKDLTAKLTQLDCRVFFVDNHIQAFEWAAALPFCAILLNGFLPDARATAVRRLRHLADEHLIDPIPLWVMSLPPSLEPEWRQEGISETLTVPIQPQRLQALCKNLPPLPTNFYQAYDAQQHAEMPQNILTRLPELNRHLAQQILTVESALLSLSLGDVPLDLIDDAHAVKSAALTLGYFRLAALMAEIEHAIAAQQFAKSPEQWTIIADCLRSSGFHS